MPPRKRTPTKATPRQPTNVLPFEKPEPQRPPPKRAPRKPGSKTPDAAGIRKAERTKLALELRLAGRTLQQISDALSDKFDQPGYNRASVARDIREAMESVVQEPAIDLLDRELATLFTAQSAIWPKVRDGDVQAVAALLRIMDRRSRYLGLDAPYKQQLIGVDQNPSVALNLSDPTELAEQGLALLEDMVKDRKDRRRAAASGDE